MEFNMIKRISLIIYMKNIKKAKKLKKYGRIEYISIRMNYVVLYIDNEDLDKIYEIINKFGFVKDIKLSYLKDLDTTVTKDYKNIDYEVDNLNESTIEIDDFNV